MSPSLPPPPYLLSIPFSLPLSSGPVADGHREGRLHGQGGGWDGRGRLRVLPWGEIRPGLQIPTRFRETHLWRGAGWHLPGLRQQLPRWIIIVVFVDPETKWSFINFSPLPLSGVHRGPVRPGRLGGLVPSDGTGGDPGCRGRPDGDQP